ncbi:MAG TPA: hypothetical protein VH105_21250 [Burkholderiales bacterium]|nr:hypothetical protein [Burkholderiales bacterium]
MTALKFIAAAAIFSAASIAFAGTDDGVIDSFPGQTRASVQAPAPAASAAVTKQAVAKNAAQTDFIRQLGESSDAGVQ